MFDQRRHSPPTIKIHQSSNDRFALGSGFGESHGFSEL